MEGTGGPLYWDGEGPQYAASGTYYQCRGYSWCTYYGTCCPDTHIPEMVGGMLPQKPGCCKECATRKTFKLYDGHDNYANYYSCPEGYEPDENFKSEGFSTG